MHGVSKASVCRALHSVVNGVIQEVFINQVKFPPNMEETVHNFHAIAGMPLVCGCIDGTLINIDAPHVDEPAYVERHGKHSINCMVVCGPNLMFYYSYANWPGSVHDARVLRNSGLYRRMEEGLATIS